MYASYDASQETPETLNSFYNYNCSDSMRSWNRNIRSGFGEEDHKIQAHNHHVEILKFISMDSDLNEITNGVPGRSR